MESGECISEFSEIIPSGPLFGQSGTLNFIENNYFNQFLSAKFRMVFGQGLFL
jgi:hypothetical protein